MWYEIVPSFVGVVTCLAVPSLYIYYSNKLFLKQPYRREIGTNEDCFHYLRDSRLSNRNWAYDLMGLENIPDLEQPKAPIKAVEKC